MWPVHVPTIDLADGALTGPPQEAAAAGAAIGVVLVVVADCECVLVVDDCQPHPAPASASAAARRRLRASALTPPLGRIDAEQLTDPGPVIFYQAPLGHRVITCDSGDSSLCRPSARRASGPPGSFKPFADDRWAGVDADDF